MVQKVELLKNATEKLVLNESTRQGDDVLFAEGGKPFRYAAQLSVRSSFPSRTRPTSKLSQKLQTPYNNGSADLPRIDVPILQFQCVLPESLTTAQVDEQLKLAQSMVTSAFLAAFAKDYIRP